MEIHLSLPGPPPPAPCALQQQPGYGQALLAMGARVKLLTATQNGTVIAHAQVVERTLGPARLVWLPRGPVWACHTTPGLKQQVLARLPRAMGKSAIWLGAPDDAGDADHFKALRYRSVVTPQYVAELDLRKSPETRLRAQHGKWRNRLRHAQKSGLCLSHRPFNPARDQALLAHEFDQRRARRYSALPPAFTLAWASNNPKASRLFLVQNKAGIMAFLLILLHAPTATYHIGWTNAEGRGNSAHNLALWQASNWLSDHGFDRLDLGIVDTENAPGLARFKIGSGAQVRALGPTLLRLPIIPSSRTARNAAA